jgi:hypothetical protein
MRSKYDVLLLSVDGSPLCVKRAMTFRLPAFIACFVTLLMPLTAPAETGAVEGGGASSTPGFTSSIDHSTARFRFDVAANLTLGFAGPPPNPVGGSYPSSLTGIVAGPGLQVDVGAQLGDRVAVYARAQAIGFGPPVSPFVSQAAGYAVADWTPRRWISLGTGLGYEMLAPPAGCNGTGTAGCPEGPHWFGLSVPLIVGFNLLESGDPNRVRRTALRIGIDGAGGVDLSTGAIGWHAALSLGLALM